MVKIDKQKTIHFNKELLFGEAGGLIGTQSFSYLTAQFTANLKTISASVVFGAMIGAICWTLMRIHHQKKSKTHSASNLAWDMAYFTPAAIIISILVYYPILYFMSYHFLTGRHTIFSSVITAQITAFLCFLLPINLYRYLLAKLHGKVL
jgi:hypothetical protein